MFVVLATSGGVDAAPKYTSYDVAPVEAFQVKEGASETLVAPLAGDTSTGAAGALAGVMEST